MDFLSSGFNILLMILGFGLLIFVHELGHFLAAKWAGIRTEAFAIGMGPVIVSWRKGIGMAAGSTDRRVRAMTGRSAHELSDGDLARHGLGETEYSLRWLPIGGFVKMLGQEDANPSAASSDPRSYTQRPIGKRMVVVSAGVIMNLILAAVLFVLAFMVGVPFEKPVVGEVSPTLPAGRAVAKNAAALGVDRPGLQGGDEVIAIDGKKAATFADLQIATAMGRTDVAVELEVQRPGLAAPLIFEMAPEKDPATGLLGIGVSPASSNRLASGKDVEEHVQKALERSGLWEAGVRPGMLLVSAGGQPATTYEDLHRAVEASDGQPVATAWAEADEQGEASSRLVRGELPVQPIWQALVYAEKREQVNYELGLLGISPLVRVVSAEGSDNEEILRPGDVILRVASVDGPRTGDFVTELAAHRGRPVELLVLREGRETSVTASVDRKGKLGVAIDLATDLPLVAEPMHEVRRSLAAEDKHAARRTAVAGLELLPRTRFLAIEGTPVGDWAELRAALREHTREAHRSSSGATVALTVENPTPGREHETRDLVLSAEDVSDLHELGWSSDLPSFGFEPVMVTLTADGNPLRAIVMGLERTHKLIVLTYLTLDRLVRGSVGVEQLRGPVGIVHLGTKIVDRGFIYLVFLLGMISVNLAVINFLPIPIVDGGLFLFLVYEKLKGRPPSLAFQNAATVVGLIFIGTVLLVVTWNDVMRLIG